VLERLRIRDLALVDEAAIPFEAGLNVVTGETGAGKSLIVEAISLLMGDKPDADTVREGAEGARVEGEFRVTGETARRVGELLAGWNVEFDGETVIVRRDVSAAGRSRATVNESAVTQAALKRLGEALVDLHGQHEHQSLLREGAGLDVLDALAGLAAEREAYAERWAAWRESQAEEERIERTLATFAERRDVLRHAAAEIDEARLEAGEEETLRLDAARLQHADRLRQLVGGALDRLAEGEGAAAEALAAAGHALEQAAALDDSLAALAPTLEEARITASETARALAAYAEDLEADPAALETIEARRDLLSRLTHKYRRDVPALIAWRAELEAEIATGEDGEGALDRAGERERAARCRGPARRPRASGGRASPRTCVRSACRRRVSSSASRARIRRPRRSGRAASTTWRWSSRRIPARARGRSSASLRAASCRGSCSLSRRRWKPKTALTFWFSTK